MRRYPQNIGRAYNAPLNAMTHELARLTGRPGKVALLKQRKIGAALLSESR